MTLEELYGKVLADEGLKEEFANAAKEEKIVEWVAAQGVDATEEEIVAFVKGAANEKLDVDDVDQVTGAGYGSWLESTTKSAVSEITMVPMFC